MLVFFSDRHKIHCPQTFLVRGRPHPNPESPERIEAILGAARADAHSLVHATSYADEQLGAVHSADYLTFLGSAWARWVALTGTEDEIIAQVHPNRHMGGHPTGILGQVGQYIADSNCPMHAGTFTAAKAAAHTALSATEAVLNGERVSYAACRPPGHHAFRDAASGFCILNNVAIAAEYARKRADRVAILDIDIHHGNGTQSIFYDRPDVLFVSIHRDPLDFYPFYSGYADERGIGAGAGFNLNIPLSAGYGDGACLEALATASERIRQFRPHLLLVSLGFDAHERDPHGKGRMSTLGFAAVSQAIRALGVPTVLVQEGGYLSPELGPTLAQFLQAFEGPDTQR